MYSIEDFVIPNLTSIVLSLLLVFGFSFVGSNIVRFAGFSSDDNRWLKFQYPIIGISFISAFLYPLALFHLLNSITLKILAFIIFTLGLIYGLKILKLLIQISKSKAVTIGSGLNKALLLVIISLVVCYFLFSIGPTTNADSIDYHLGIAISIINNGGITVTPEWFHSRLAGSGEVLNALGLVIGAEQFGPLMQFFP